MAEKKVRQVSIPLAMERYYKYRLQGLNKKHSALKAGYSPSIANSVKGGIEDKKSYQELLLIKGLKKEAVIVEHNFVIKQRKDLKAKNQAIDMRYKLDNAYPKGETDANMPNVQIFFGKKEQE